MGKLDEISEKAVRESIETVRMGWPIGMPAARSLGHGLWELRTRTPRGQARVIFCFSGRVMILLHGFIKKSAKTPRRELELAQRRSRDVVRRGSQ